MRIAQVCQSYPPMISGAALAAQRLAHGLAGRGHAVCVLAASERGPAYREFSGGVELARLRAHANPFRSQQRFVLRPGSALLAALRAFEPDVVHLHDTTTMGLLGLWAARQLGRPALLTLHALPDLVLAYVPPVPGLKRLTEAALWAYGRQFAAGCQALVAPSLSAAQVVKQRLGRSAQVIASGVDLEVCRPEPIFAGEADVLRRKYGLEPGSPILLYVGRLDIEKRVEVVVRAAARVLRQASAQLLIVGDGTQRRALIELSRQLGIGDRTHFAGFVSPLGDLAGLYRLANIFVNASQAETACLVVAEAAASGLPVVAMNAPALAEVVCHGVSGYLVAGNDPAGMSERLAELLAEPARARGMGQAGRAKIARSHDFSAALTAYEDLYRQLARTN